MHLKCVSKEDYPNKNLLQVVTATHERIINWPYAYLKIFFYKNNLFIIRLTNTFFNHLTVNNGNK